MSRWFPRTYLRWKEPRFAQRWREEQDQKKYTPLFRIGMLALSIAFLSPGIYLTRYLRDPESAALPVSLAGGLLMGLVAIYGLPFVARLHASIVHITEVGIHRTLGSHVTSLRFEDVEKCSLEGRLIEGRMIFLLSMMTKEGRPYELAVAPELSLHEIAALLEQNGVRIDPVTSSSAWPRPARAP